MPDHSYKEIVARQRTSGIITFYCQMTGLRKIVIGIALSFVFVQAYSQERLSQPGRMDRYRINFPKTWKKPRIIKAVTHILNSTIDELKDLDFCTECKARYYVFLFIDSVRNREDSYSFYASFRTYDSTGMPIVDLQLVSASEVFDKTKIIKFERVPPTIGLQPGRGPDETFLNNQDVFVVNRRKVVTTEELKIIEICKSRVLQINKLLQKIE